MSIIFAAFPRQKPAQKSLAKYVKHAMMNNVRGVRNDSSVGEKTNGDENDDGELYA